MVNAAKSPAGPGEEDGASRSNTGSYQPTLDAAERPDDEFWNARPELMHIYRFAAARCVAPWATLGVVLARVVTATSYRCQLPIIVGGPASLNLFVGLVAPSGVGKGAATTAGTAAVDVGKIEKIGAGSGEGIAHCFRKRSRDGELEWHNDTHAVLYDVAEVATLGALKSRQASSTLPELCKVWSGEELGQAYVDQTKKLSVPAHSYRLCVLVGIQPVRAAILFDDEDGGTPQRFLWLPAYDPSILDRLDEPRPVEPQPLRWSYPLLGRSVSKGGEGHVMSVPASIVAHLRREAMRRQGLDLDAEQSHWGLVKLKVAAALALLNRRVDVNDEDWYLAGVVMCVSERTRLRCKRDIEAKHRDAIKGQAHAEIFKASVVEDAAANREDKIAERITAALTKAEPGDDVYRTPLMKVFVSRERALASKVLAQMVTDGTVVEDAHDRYPTYRLA